MYLKIFENIRDKSDNYKYQLIKFDFREGSLLREIPLHNKHSFGTHKKKSALLRQPGS